MSPTPKSHFMTLGLHEVTHGLHEGTVPGSLGLSIFRVDGRKRNSWEFGDGKEGRHHAYREDSGSRPSSGTWGPGSSRPLAPTS